MANLTKQDMKMAKLVKAVRDNPNSTKAWAALACESYEVAESLRDLLVELGQMTLEA